MTNVDENHKKKKKEHLLFNEFTYSPRAYASRVAPPPSTPLHRSMFGPTHNVNRNNKNSGRSCHVNEDPSVMVKTELPNCIYSKCEEEPEEEERESSLIRQPYKNIPPCPIRRCGFKDTRMAKFLMMSLC
ncbi:hypothetical protein CBL_03268 [Carabus blaptoides fortunei]